MAQGSNQRIKEWNDHVAWSVLHWKGLLEKSERCPCVEATLGKIQRVIGIEVEGQLVHDPPPFDAA